MMQSLERKVERRGWGRIQVGEQKNISPPKLSPRTQPSQPRKNTNYKKFKYEKLPETQHFCYKSLKVTAICFILQYLGVLGANFPQGTVQAGRAATNTSSLGPMQLTSRFRAAAAEHRWPIWGVPRPFSSRASLEHLISFKEIKCYSLLPPPHAKLGCYL